MLPSVGEQKEWEDDRIALKGDGPAFTMINPDFEAYFEEMRSLAGEPRDGTGRRLPPFDPKWVDDFNAGHQRRIKMWKRANLAAKQATQLFSQL